MVGYSVTLDSSTKDVRQPAMTQRELIQKITDVCIGAGLSYDGLPPVQVSPGVWMFYAVECSRKGHCRQHPRYAIQKGDRVILS